ncbi:MAG: aldolase/citrate lyase family protein [Bacteroidota bacterium]
MTKQKNVAMAGNTGKGVKSDCQVTLEITSSGGLKIDLKSKVNVLYGKSILELIHKMLSSYGIKNAVLTMEDSGALPFVLMARLENVIRECLGTEKEFLPEMLKENKYETKRDKNRFSRLYLPGNTPNLMFNAGIHRPDGIILDLEDSVAPSKKKEAQLLVRNALCAVNYYGAERMVRINQVPAGLDDLKYIVPHYVNLILVPKCESAEQIRQVEAEIEKIRKEYKVKYPIWLMPIIESALGVINAYEIAKASPNVVSLAIGLEDYTADIAARRTKEATESFFARSMVVNAARAAGIQPIDSVFSDVGDMEGLKNNVIASKGLGYEGMGCIHPRQIRVIHEYYAPDSAEIEKSKKIVLAFDEATAKGLGVVSLGTKMIDPPVVKRALKMIDIAVKLGKISKNWKEEMNDGK